MLSVIWAQLAYWANSLIFILVGLAVPHLVLDADLGLLGILAVLIVAAFVARAAILFGLLPGLGALGLTERFAGTHQAVMLWGGLRGAVSLALALMVLESPGFDPEVKSFVVFSVTGLVLFTLFVNAPTMRPLLHRFGLDELSPTELAVRNRAMALSLSHLREIIDRVAQSYRVEPGLAREIAGAYEQRLAAVEGRIGASAGLSHDDRVQIALRAAVHQERRLYLRHLAEHLISPDIARRLLADSERLLDGVKTAGAGGYRSAFERTLGFPPSFRIALAAQRRLGIAGPLASRLADRFEVLLAAETVLGEIKAEHGDTIVSLFGEDAWRDVEQMLSHRLAATAKALGALRLQYPDYARALETRFLGRVALRIEDEDYRRMLDEAALSDEIFRDLERGLYERGDVLDRRPVLDLGLEPRKLVARVPLFAPLPAETIAEIARLLKPRLVLPGERVVEKGEAGDAMYFLTSGAVEVAVAPEPVRLGSGDFFGELALIKDIRRTADVTALGYCQCLVLHGRDLRGFLATNPAIERTLTQVAEERLAENRAGHRRPGSATPEP